MAFRVSVFCSQKVGIRQGGWSINWWNAATDQSAVVTRTRALAMAIFNFTGVGVSVNGARIQDLSAFRAALTEVYADLSSVASNIDRAADYPTTKALVRLSGPQKYQTNMWIGTLPNYATTTGGIYTPPPLIVGYWNALAGILQNAANQWSIYSQDKTLEKKDVTAISAAGVVTCPAHGLATGDHTRISRVKGFTSPTINKVWLVTVIDPNTFQLVPAPTVVGAMTSPGKSQKQSRIMQQIATAEVVRTTKHNVGRPFGLFSGRRRRRPI